MNKCEICFEIHSTENICLQINESSSLFTWDIIMEYLFKNIATHVQLQWMQMYMYPNFTSLALWKYNIYRLYYDKYSL